MNYKNIILLNYLCIASVSAVILTPALPQIQNFYGIDSPDLSWFVAIFLLGYVFGNLIYAPLANTYGRLKAIRFGFLLNLTGITICYLASIDILYSYKLLLIGRLITALGASAGLACTFTIINELLAPNKAKVVISYSTLSFMLGIALAVTLGGIVTQYMDWQDLFIFLFIHGLLAYVSTYFFPETLKTKHRLHPTVIIHQYAYAFAKHQLRHYALIVGLSSTISYAYAAAAPIIAHTMLNLTPGGLRILEPIKHSWKRHQWVICTSSFKIVFCQ